MRPEQLTWKADALNRGPGEPVRIRWLGTAGFAIEHQGQVLLIDPYLTRASLGTCITRSLQSDRARLASLVPRADVIVAGHTHFDHVLDVPALALSTGAPVFGSRSCAALCRLSGVPATQVHVVEPGPGDWRAEAEVGPFRLRFLPSKHSPLMLGRVPFPGEIADCDQVPLRTEHYRCGAVFSVEVRVGGRVLLHLGSAELVEASIDCRSPDLLLLCVAGWTSSRSLPERVARAFEPKAILLSHWDDFFRSLDRPVRALPGLVIRFGELTERLQSARPDARLGTLPLLGELLI